MNQEIKSKLKQAAETAWEQDQKTNPSPVNPHAYVYGYKAGAQTILENPGEWGLETTKEALTGRNRVTSLQLQNAKLKTENERYRKALEKIADPIADMESELKEGESLNGAYAIKIASDGRYLSEIAKEALKQHNND